jgi:hypothetical protein
MHSPIAATALLEPIPRKRISPKAAARFAGRAFRALLRFPTRTVRKPQAVVTLATINMSTTDEVGSRTRYLAGAETSVDPKDMGQPMWQAHPARLGGCHETPRVHYAARRRGGGVAACGGERTAADKTCSGLSSSSFARELWSIRNCFSKRSCGIRLYRKPEYRNRIPLGRRTL